MATSAVSALPEKVQASLFNELMRVRATTVSLCEPLEPEDCVVQSAPETSPAKWHLAHTTWFFETFVLAPFMQVTSRSTTRSLFCLTLTMNRWVRFIHEVTGVF